MTHLVSLFKLSGISFRKRHPVLSRDFLGWGSNARTGRLFLCSAFCPSNRYRVNDRIVDRMEPEVFSLAQFVQLKQAA